MRSFEAGDDHDHEGTSASIGQSSQSRSVDILKKHQSKSIAPLVNHLPDPRAMAEIRSGLEDESYKAEMVRNSWYFPIFFAIKYCDVFIYCRISVQVRRYCCFMLSADAVVICFSGSGE